MKVQILAETEDVIVEPHERFVCGKDGRRSLLERLSSLEQDFYRNKESSIKKLKELDTRFENSRAVEHDHSLRSVDKALL